MLTHAIINHKMIPTTMSTFDELGIELRRRLREHDLNQLELSKVLGKSRSWVAQELLGKPEQTIRRLFINEPRALNELAARLGWPSGVEMMHSLGLLERENVYEKVAPKPSQAHLTELEDPNLSPVYAIADAHRPQSYQTIPLENLQVWVAPNNRRPGLKLYAASGHSMDNGAQNAIKDGFILYVDTNEREARDGGLYVIHVHGDGNCVKRARVLGGQFWLFSDNVDQGKYPPFQPDEADIIGEVYLFQAPPQKP